MSTVHILKKLDLVKVCFLDTDQKNSSLWGGGGLVFIAKCCPTNKVAYERVKHVMHIINFAGKHVSTPYLMTQFFSFVPHVR